MLDIIATIFMVSVGVMFGLVILAYAIYLTFYPLARTVSGGLEVLRHFGEERLRAYKRDYALIPDARLGYTMADGGQRIKRRTAKKTK